MKISHVVLALGLLCFSSAAFAQDTTSSGKSKSEQRTVTGCLTQGTSADKFVLNGNDGSTWDLKTEQVALAEHVGHTVTIKGKVEDSTMHNMKEETKDAASSAHMTKSNNEHGTLDVASVKMVSKSCKQ